MTTPSTASAVRSATSRWHRHPGVRSGPQLSSGERWADRLRNGMGSWAFVFAALLFLAVWMLINRGSGFDPYPFILLNLLLSCVAAMQGAILLIAAKRSDQVSSELAEHDYQTDCTAEQLVQDLRADLAGLHEEQRRLGRMLVVALNLPEDPQTGDGAQK